MPNADEIANYLGVYEKARQAGARELPSSEQQTHDGTEAQIIQHVESRVQEFRAERELALTGFTDRIAGTDIHKHLAAIESVAQGFQQALGNLLQVAHPRLAEIIRDHQAAIAEFRAFQAEHDLTRQPSAPSTRALVWAVAAFLVVVEAVLNAWFFAQGLETGLLGGAIQALVFALVDIVVVYNLGAAMRFVSRKELILRTVGVAAALAALAWVVAYNLGVAHYRDQLRLDPLAAGTATLSSFRDAPFGLHDIESWELFALGLLFSIGGVVTGYKSDDRYPGYGAVHRQVMEARSALVHDRDVLLAEAAEMRDARLEQVDRIPKDASVELVALQNAIHTKEQVIRVLVDFASASELAANACIRMYRSENRKTRKTPVPTYFDTEWEYPVPKKWEYDSAPDRRKLASQTRILERIRRQAQDVRNQVGTHYTSFLDDMKWVDRELNGEEPNP